MTTASRNFHLRLLDLFTHVKPGEGKCVLLLFINAFILLFSYYLLKPTREALLLAENTAEIRSYAVAGQALILLFIIPIYSYVARNKLVDKAKIVFWVSLFIISNLLGFYVLGQAGLPIAVPFFLWVGIFSVMVVAQFWALSADLFSVEQGQRLFVLIAVGGSLGAWAGSRVASTLFAYFGAYNLMLLSCALLCLTVVICAYVTKRAPDRRSITTATKDPAQHNIMGGFAVVLNDRYLRLIAVFVVLLNCINTTGEYILAKLVVAQADLVQASAADGFDKSVYIGQFYGDFYSWVNLLSLLMQLFLVARLYRTIGVRGALYILPIIALLGYALILFIPIFGIIRLVKIIENSADYSIQNTTRHVLFLPTSRSAKYEGKTAIDTFFWRFGDLLQALIVFAGTTYFGFQIQSFAILNLLLAAVWIYVVSIIASEHSKLPQEGPTSRR